MAIFALSNISGSVGYIGDVMGTFGKVGGMLGMKGRVAEVGVCLGRQAIRVQSNSVNFGISVYINL